MASGGGDFLAILHWIRSIGPVKGGSIIWSHWAGSADSKVAELELYGNGTKLQCIGTDGTADQVITVLGGKM